MFPRPLPLLERLRRHRGLWALVLAVLFIKLLSGSVCLADGGERDTFDGGTRAVGAMTVDASPAAPAGDGDCLLGEGSSCHCACAHALALPVSAVLAVHAQQAFFAASLIDAGRVPDATASLLRPPIA
jgi:hypothetical protein